MIIKDVRITLLRAPYKEQPGFQRGYDRPREILAVEIETKSGLVGLGYQLYLRQGFRTTKACLEELLIPRIMGRDATAVEAIWRDLFMSTQADGRGGAPVLGLSVIDVALWDLVGQRAKMPLHRIWGHFRDKVPAYGSGVWRGRTAKAISTAVAGGRRRSAPSSSTEAESAQWMSSSTSTSGVGVPSRSRSARTARWLR